MAEAVPWAQAETLGVDFVVFVQTLWRKDEDEDGATLGNTNVAYITTHFPPFKTQTATLSSAQR